MSRSVPFPASGTRDARDRDTPCNPPAERSCRRRLYIVDLPLQLRLTKPFAGFALLALVLGCADVYVMAALAEASTAVLSENSSQRIAIWGYGTLSIVANFALFFLVALLYSHRLAGPQVKLLKTLKQLQHGELSLQVKLRSNDYLREIASAVNGVTEEWDLRIKTMREALQTLKDRTAALDRPDVLDAISSIEQVLNKFKVEGYEPGNDPA